VVHAEQLSIREWETDRRGMESRLSTCRRGLSKKERKRAGKRKCRRKNTFESKEGEDFEKMDRHWGTDSELFHVVRKKTG